ncbi:aspartate dehydrogenase [Tissierella sp. Yu-01]|uniref:aspartate dehydrogenase n=1 Tax=Tissierella sp. Yu-01 TaxID=3035694 RepID=UPI00240DC1BF|nr:aspartate dehydrogenase [Tissierella sp. Yu-01]WFA08123.1 aspartate dehydrogenase [Tissierella sp. Yu-01]
MQKKRISLIGCGTLGKIFLEVFEKHINKEYEIDGILIRTTEHIREFAKDHNYFLYDSIESLLERKPDYVVEFASANAVRKYGKQILGAGVSLVVVSVGALADEELYNMLKREAKVSNAKLYIPSGAIGGFDLMRTIALGQDAKVKITNLKAPASLKGAPYLKGRTLSLESEEIIFKGNAKEAIQGFPKNVNVAVAASLAVSNMEDAEVEIHSVPGQPSNTHRIEAENSFAKTKIEISSIPDPVNPKSSVITAWSVVALLKNLIDPIQFF